MRIASRAQRNVYWRATREGCSGRFLILSEMPRAEAGAHKALEP